MTFFYMMIVMKVTRDMKNKKYNGGLIIVLYSTSCIENDKPEEN